MKKLLFILSVFVFIGGAVSGVSAAVWTVTKSANSNDGACNADCSLREAVAAASSGDTVVFNSSLIGQTFALGGTPIEYVGKRIEIDGNLDGVNVVLLSGGGTTYHFDIQDNASLTLKNMILAQGGGSQYGSIFAFNSNLFLDRVAIRGNSASTFGAIHLLSSGAPTSHAITNSSITGNTTTGGGGAQISAIEVSPLSVLYMSNTTIGNNRNLGNNAPEVNFGAIHTSGKLFLRNCTITENEGNQGGGVTVTGTDPSNVFDVGNSIIAGNSATTIGQDIYITPNTDTVTISRGGNLIGDTESIPAGIFTQTNDAVNVDPLLAPTNSNQGGHPVATHPLQAGSPAINGGLNSVAVEPLSNLPLTQDARGAAFPRIAGGTVDKGAFEDQTNGASLVVTKLTNSNDGTCDTDCSLREAVGAAADDAGTETITFAANVFGTLSLGGSEILIQNNDVNIVGYPGLTAETLIVSGSNTNRIFRINNSDVSLTGMTFANGNGTGAVSSGFGGAIYAHGGANVTLDRVIVRNNAATTYGALYLLGGTHRIVNSTINNNQATSCIAIGNVNGTLHMANATLSTNLDSNGGTGAGALCNIGATANIRNSTIAFNRIGSDAGAGIWSSGTLNLGNTIVAGNIAGSNPDINNASGTVTSAGGNLVQDANGLPFSALNAANDQTGVDPLLNALDSNGGNVPTHSLMPQSPAINTGLNSNAVDPFDNSALATDARGAGFMRIVSIVDKGAFESLIPTSAGVTVAGKVFDGEGKPASNAKVYLTDSQGVTRIATTNNFGNFAFDTVSVGETYIINVTAKKWQYNPQVINVAEEISDLTFAPEE
jgi:CSLREA domain-containing protein